MKKALTIAGILIIVGVICVALGTVIASSKKDIIIPDETPTETVFSKSYEIPANHPLATDDTPAYESLTLSELMACPMPKNFTRMVYKDDEKVMEEFANFLPTDNFNAIVIELYPFKSIELISSSIEDGMIYSVCKVIKNDDTEAELLIINQPNTLQYVAATWTTDNYDSYSIYEYRY